MLTLPLHRSASRLPLLAALACAVACGSSLVAPEDEPSPASPDVADAASSYTSADGGVTPEDARDASAAMPPMVMPAFIVGYNEAWFGSKFGTDLTTDFDLAYVNTTFDGIVKGGGHVVRLFLFELLQGIALGTTPPQTQSLSTAMLANVGKVLDAARARGLWVYLTALEGNEITKVPATKTYYRNLVSDAAGEGAAFENNVLAPLLEVLDAHKENVFGFDLMNELDTPRNEGLWSDPFNGPRGFVQRTTAFIKSKSPWARVTTTLGFGGIPSAQVSLANGFLSGLGLDFYDIHIYSDSGTYPGASDVCSRAASDGVPVYLGEFGQKSHTTDDTLQYNAAASFLSTAKSLCFKGALAWRYDTAENWWAYIGPDGGFRPAVSLIQVFGQ